VGLSKPVTGRLYLYLYIIIINFYAYNSNDIEMVAGRRYGFAEEGVMLQFSPGARFLSLHHTPDWLSDPISLLFNVYDLSPPRPLRI